MSLSILAYLRGMFHTVKKEDVLKTAEFVFTNLDNDVLPALENVISNGDIKIIKDSDVIHNIALSVNSFKSKDNKDFFIKLKDVMTNINKQYKPFISVIEKELSDNVTDSSTNAKDATILRILNDIGSMNKYILDLVYFVIMDTEETIFPKIKSKQIRDNIPTFIATLDIYSKDFEKMVKNISEVSSVNININEGNDSMIASLISKSGKTVPLPNTTGFISNPIYHIRMWLVDREISKYESLKESKKLIELRLLELKLQEDGKASDPKLKKQIEYYENKLSRIEYEITKIEDK